MRLGSCRAIGAEASWRADRWHQLQRPRFYGLQDRPHPGAPELFFEPICSRRLCDALLRTARTSKPLRLGLEARSPRPAMESASDRSLYELRLLESRCEPATDRDMKANANITIVLWAKGNQIKMTVHCHMFDDKGVTR